MQAGLWTGQSRLDRIASMKKEARDAFQKISNEGFTLMRGQSSWARRESYFLHRGPMMGGEDVQLTPGVFRELTESGLFEPDEPLLNGWIKTYKQV